MATLITYFSRADENFFDGEIRFIKVGNTEVVCNILNQIIDADMFKIEMKKPYSASYKICIEEAKKDHKENKRPELKTYLDSIEQYDTIILAYPNYWNTMPMAVFTFLDKYDFSGKTILPLCTNEGSGLGNSIKDITNCCPDSEVGIGLSLVGSRVASSKDKVSKWLGENGIKVR
ncbi:MAG: flavodoxin [Clostridiales bacterium]|nr:flavodoxin [Clostridiales bacterium]